MKQNLIMSSRPLLLAGLAAILLGVAAPFTATAQEAAEHATRLRMRVQTMPTGEANGSADDFDLRLSAQDSERVEYKSVSTYPTTSQCQARGKGGKQCLESAVEVGTAGSVVAAVMPDGVHIDLILTRTDTSFMSFNTTSGLGDDSVILPAVSMQHLQQTFVLRQGESATVAMSSRTSVKLTLESIETPASQAK